MNIITKDYFYKNINLEDGFTSLYLEKDLLYNEKEDESESPLMEYYFEIPGKGIFIALPLFKRVIIPNKYLDNLSIDDILNDKGIDFSDWELVKISDKPDSRYILNQYCKHSSYYKSNNIISIEEEGSYLLKNDRIGECIDFSMIISNKYDSKTKYFCFPEKTENRLHIKEINKKENFIIFVTNGKIGKTDSGSNIPG